MRILFDNCTPAPLRRYLEPHSVDTAAELDWEEMQILQQLGMIKSQPPTRARDIRRLYQADHSHPLWALIDTCTQLARTGR